MAKSGGVTVAKDGVQVIGRIDLRDGDGSSGKEAE